MNSKYISSKQQLEDPNLLKEYNDALETLGRALKGDPAQESTVSRKEINQAHKTLNNVFKIMRSHNSEVRLFNDCLRTANRVKKMLTAE